MQINIGQFSQFIGIHMIFTNFGRQSIAGQGENPFELLFENDILLNRCWRRLQLWTWSFLFLFKLYRLKNDLFQFFAHSKFWQSKKLNAVIKWFLHYYSLLVRWSRVISERDEHTQFAHNHSNELLLKRNYHENCTHINSKTSALLMCTVHSKG